MVAKRFKLYCLATALSLWVAACGGGQAGGLEQVASVVSQPAPSKQQYQRVGIGIGGLSYYDRSFAMVDVSRQSQVRGLDWSYDLSVDPEGYPQKDFQLIYSATKIASGTYKLSFTGRAAVAAGGAGAIRNTVYDPATNTTKCDVVLANEASGNVWLLFKDTYRNSASTKGDGVTNIHLWRPGYSADGSALFTDEFVVAMQKFKVLRGMDFVGANGNSQVSWTERTKPNFFGSPGPNGQSWELLIALANATDRDVWLNVPVKANDDYIRKLAQLIKFGSDGNLPYTSAQARPIYPALKVGLNVYVEYGNEVWNSGPDFKGFRWALELANTNKSDVKHPIAFDGVQSDQYIALRRWIAYRSATISLAFREVFGDAAMMSTVRPIFSTQSGNANSYLYIGLAWAQAFYGQVRTALPANATVRKPSEIWYGGGGAAYYEAGVDPKDTAASTMDRYFASLPTAAFEKTSAVDSIWTHAYGLRYVAYEGGPGPGGSALGSVTGATVSSTYNNDPRMKDRMLLAQDIWDQAGGDEMVYYVYSSSAPWSFTNELVQQVVSDTSSVKLQAIDAINAKPKPEVTLGQLIPATIALKDPASQVIGADPATWALSGSTFLLRPNVGNPYVLVPIRTTKAGTYRVSINTGTKVTGSVAMFVNGNSQGAIKLSPDLINNTTVSSKVTVTLPAGLSVLRLDTPQGDGDIFVRDLVVE